MSFHAWLRTVGAAVQVAASRARCAGVTPILVIRLRTPGAGIPVTRRRSLSIEGARRGLRARRGPCPLGGEVLDPTALLPGQPRSAG
ncbi:hypothetical protein QJS66_05055 [Kocuria rhizophila]|nr:hypothetical protein QJS66_05055 [Kocuria rhizophila]